MLIGADDISNDGITLGTYFKSDIKSDVTSTI